MNTKIKKNLWWLISSIVLFIPLALFVSAIRIEASERLEVGAVFFCIQLIIWAIIGLIANKIKKIVFKIVWIIIGILFDIIFLFLSFFAVGILDSHTEENIEMRKEGIRDMVYNEFNENEYLDNILGIQLPTYKIVDSKCDYASVFPTETEYNVKLKIYFPKGLSSSIRKEIHKLASEKASNPLSKGNVINEWGFREDNPREIYYQTEDAINVGCVVIFKPQCDTVYVTRYKW